MEVTITLFYGPRHNANVIQEQMQESIDAINRAVHGGKTVSDDVKLMEIKSILVGIQKQLPLE